jgi:uncharacterized protein (DUF302 family)
MKYGITKLSGLSFEQTIIKVTEELKKEGFGVLTTIDVQETLKKKLDKKIEKYVILGACNPPFAHQVLMAEKEMGLFLPCNVIVYEENSKIVVSAFDPTVIENILSNPVVDTVAKEMKTRLERVIAAV